MTMEVWEGPVEDEYREPPRPREQAFREFDERTLALCKEICRETTHGYGDPPCYKLTPEERGGGDWIPCCHCEAGATIVLKHILALPAPPSPSDPEVIIAGIKKFGLAADGADLRDLNTSLMAQKLINQRLRQIVAEKDIIIEELMNAFDKPA